ncbi:MAG: hypothetical protein HY074_06735 [Deltaproteobacteria bacterium]|nr:hypothetical protein [Deltaproteobacteria bacterium]
MASSLFAGCGNYTATTRAARNEFYAGKYTEAAKALEKGAHEDSLDQLLYLFDRATALHQAGDYDESNKDFAAADKMSEIKDYTSLSREAATLVTNDKIIQYKGEDFEKVLVSQYLALNYLMMHKYEDALVECRRVNQKLHMMISQGKRKYKLNPMASYVSALMWEDQHEWNDAYVDYQAVYALIPEMSYLGDDLYRLAWINNITEDMDKWARQYNLSGDDKKRIRDTAKLPEIVVIVENGHSPEKQPNPAWTALPKYYPRNNPVAFAEVSVNGQVRGRSQMLFNVEKTAIENMDEKFAGLLAKRIGGVVAKEVIADQVGKRTDPLIGKLLSFGMHAIDQADLRSWLTLPKDFQVFRVRVPLAPSYTVQIRPKNGAGDNALSASGVLEKIVHFEPGKPGQRVFIHVRVL